MDVDQRYTQDTEGSIMSAHCHICWHAFQLGDKALAAVSPDGKQFVLLCDKDAARIPSAVRQQARVAGGIGIYTVTAQYQQPYHLMALNTVRLDQWLFDVSRSDFMGIPGEGTPPPLPWR